MVSPQRLHEAGAFCSILRQDYGGQEASSGQARCEAIKEEIGRGGVRVNLRTLLRYLGKTGKVCTE
jgi:hypothetical protein